MTTSYQSLLDSRSQDISDIMAKMAQMCQNMTKVYEQYNSGYLTQPEVIRTLGDIVAETNKSVNGSKLPKTSDVVLVGHTVGFVVDVHESGQHVLIEYEPDTPGVKTTFVTKVGNLQYIGRNGDIDAVWDLVT